MLKPFFSEGENVWLRTGCENDCFRRTGKMGLYVVRRKMKQCNWFPLPGLGFNVSFVWQSKISSQAFWNLGAKTNQGIGHSYQAGLRSWAYGCRNYFLVETISIRNPSKLAPPLRVCPAFDFPIFLFGKKLLFQNFFWAISRRVLLRPRLTTIWVLSGCDFLWSAGISSAETLGPKTLHVYWMASKLVGISQIRSKKGRSFSTGLLSRN